MCYRLFHFDHKKKIKLCVFDAIFDALRVISLVNQLTPPSRSEFFFGCRHRCIVDGFQKKNVFQEKKLASSIFFETTKTQFQILD